jgi:hypothetical protein
MVSSKLTTIQAEIKGEKKRKNDFNNFMYRNVEDIYNEVKPLLSREGITLYVTDEVVDIGGKAFIKASAHLKDEKDEMTCEGWAAIDFNHKGWDMSQATGAASSYARKYALNGLFLLDDSKDPDATSIGQQKIGKMIATSLHDRCKGDEDLEKFLLKAMGIKKWDELINDHYYVLNSNWDKYVKAYGEQSS